ncbi:MAG: glycosyltransferase [Bacillus sp. (in: Bacteria)]|nr:glycosyltransferase [Bacillus sp. (in: firmicutes)]
MNTSISEGQSSAILESMSLGIPVLVSNNEGNRSIVSHGITGFIYGGEEEFLTYAQQLITDNYRRIDIGAAGKRYIAAKHCWKREIETLLQVYNNISNS